VARRAVFGQEHREHGRLATREHDPAAVGRGHGARQRQAKARALGTVADAAVEDRGHEVGRDAVTLVLDLDHHRAVRL
jgi:hypothetical protein